MAAENIPWMIQGGKHSAASGRRVLYKATGGAEGVAGLSDCRVRQAAVANGTVIVGPGGATMVNRYPGIAGEAYDGQVLTDTVVNIAANGGGSTRYDLVIARIDDWNMPGAQATPGTLPTDTVAAFKLSVVQGVGSAVKTAAELNLNYPAIALARIAIPAATSAITTAMITDLRQVARPRRSRDLYNTQPTVSSSVGGTLADFQTQANRSIIVPEWASQMKVIGHLSGIKVNTADVAGNLYINFGSGLATSQAFDLVGGSRVSLMVSDTYTIPAALRGTAQTLKLRAQRNAGTGVVVSDSYSVIVWDVEFLEVASAD